MGSSYRCTLLNHSSLPDIDFLLDVFRVISFDTGFHFKMHSHKRIEVNYIIRGSCVMVLENELVSLVKGNCILIVPYTSHDFFVNSAGGAKIVQLEFTVGQPTLHSSKELPISGLPFLNSLQKSPMSFVKIPNSPEIGDCMERIIREKRLKQNNAEDLTKLYLAELDILLWRYINKISKFPEEFENGCIRQAMEIIHKSCNTDIKMKSVADSCGVSDRYFRKLFKQHMESTPQEYCNNLKINKAVELLSNRGIAIKEIAYMAGYSTPQYFYRVFKKAFGFTPKQYRNILYGDS
jgi:AraC-like DNA-binding protein